MSIFSIFGGKKSTKVNYNININNGVQGDGPQAGGCNRRGRHHRGGFHGKRGCGRKGPMGLMKLLKMAKALSGGGLGGKSDFAAISSGPQGTTMLAGSFGNSGGGGFPGLGALNLLS